MRNLWTIGLLALILVAGACSSAKKAGSTTTAKSLVGNWDVVVAGTPMGDISAELQVMQEGGAYKAVVIGNGERMEVTNLKVDGSRLTGSFFSQAAGAEVTLDAAHKPDSDTLEGWIMDSFRVSGKRKAAAQ